MRREEDGKRGRERAFNKPERKREIRRLGEILRDASYFALRRETN